MQPAGWSTGMKLRPGAILKALCGSAVLYLAGSLVAPYISADSYGQRLRTSLERTLGRKVEIRGPVRFSLWRGPGFSAEDVVIREDPSMGFEPAAYVDSIQVRPAFWPLVSGRFVIGSVRLEDATLNLAKAGDTWNFTSFLNRSLMSATPAIHVRNGRINFKFGDTKSVFYLMNADIDISPPGSRRGGWSVACEADAARTDRPAFGLGSFALRGKWYIAPERVDLDLRLERAQLDELAALMSGQAGGVHGVVTSRLHLAGPLDGIGILGTLVVADVHRWDLLPPQGQGWPMDIRGRLNLVAQQIELESTSPVVPLTTRFRAQDYLSRPRWAVTFTWNRIPIAPVLQLAADMGAQLPPKLRISGSIDGALGYSYPGGLQGELVLHNSSVAMPDSQPLRFEQVHVMVGKGKLWLAPSLLRTADDDLARVEAVYAFDEDTLDVSISSENMKVGALRAQAGLNAVPWLEQLGSGHWSGQLRYHREPQHNAWTGSLQLTEAQITLPGLTHRLQILSARVGIDGHRIAIERLIAHAGTIAFTGDYRYEPDTPRPHRLRLSASTISAADLETELMPTLRPNSSLWARALGRRNAPDWLEQRQAEGLIRIGDLDLGGVHLEKLRARLVWDVEHVNFASFDAFVGQELTPLSHPSAPAYVDGSLAITLSPRAPVYKLSAKVHGLNWQGSKADAEGRLETSGIGARVLSNLRLFDLSLRTEDDIYVGRGAVQEDGQLLIVLTDGNKEMRLTSSLAAP
jgi:hypothetical protein